MRCYAFALVAVATVVRGTIPNANSNYYYYGKGKQGKERANSYSSYANLRAVRPARHLQDKTYTEEEMNDEWDKAIHELSQKDQDTLMNKEIPDMIKKFPQNVQDELIANLRAHFDKEINKLTEEKKTEVMGTLGTNMGKVFELLPPASREAVNDKIGVRFKALLKEVPSNKKTAVGKRLKKISKAAKDPFDGEKVAASYEDLQSKLPTAVGQKLNDDLEEILKDEVNEQDQQTQDEIYDGIGPAVNGAVKKMPRSNQQRIRNHMGAQLRSSLAKLPDKRRHEIVDNAGPIFQSVYDKLPDGVQVDVRGFELDINSTEEEIQAYEEAQAKARQAYSRCENFRDRYGMAPDEKCMAMATCIFTGMDCIKDASAGRAAQQGQQMGWELFAEDPSMKAPTDEDKFPIETIGIVGGIVGAVLVVAVIIAVVVSKGKGNQSNMGYGSMGMPMHVPMNMAQYGGAAPYGAQPYGRGQYGSVPPAGRV